MDHKSKFISPGTECLFKFATTNVLFRHAHQYRGIVSMRVCDVFVDYSFQPISKRVESWREFATVPHILDFTPEDFRVLFRFECHCVAEKLVVRGVIHTRKESKVKILKGGIGRPFFILCFIYNWNHLDFCSERPKRCSVQPVWTEDDEKSQNEILNENKIRRRELS